ncbi:MAG: hypothetical protein QW767_05200, partial [Thermoprotei archaeon]
MSFKKILSPISSKGSTVDELMKNLKVDLDLPKSIQAQGKDIVESVADIERKLRPDIIDSIVAKIRNKEFTELLGKSVLPGLEELINGFGNDISKERTRLEALEAKMGEA